MSNDARAKRLANRAHYEKTKDRQDAVLLRLDKGDSDILDDARRRLGLSRSAFVKLHLLPASEAISARAREIETAMRARGLSLATLLARALDAELSREPAGRDAAASCASEFDELFGGGPKERA
jgi:hypothetical protein